MGALSGHPNIVNILQVGVTEGNRPFIVMPYHARGSLAERVRREGRIAWPEALRIGVKLCGALETAHRTDTLHRDIKPANALVNNYGEPQLSDFGTARIAGGYKTMTGFFTGTLSYTAPEVLAGNPPTVAADVYSLAATIYALIAGGPPHERKAEEDLIAHYLRITSTPVPDLRPEGIPADVCAAIERAMSKEPDDRQQSAEEFGRQLQLAQRHNGLTADPMALSEPVAEPEMTGGTPATFTPPPAPSARQTALEAAVPDPGMFAHTKSVSPSNVPWQPGTPPPTTPPPGFTPPPGTFTPSAGSPSPLPPPQFAPPAAETPKKNLKWILIASAAVLAVVLLVVGGILLRHVVEGRGRWRGRHPSTDRRTAACLGTDRRHPHRP